MKFDSLIDKFRQRPFFTTSDVLIQMGADPQEAFTVLPRWVRQGKIIQLSRGSYLLAQKYRQIEPSMGFISNQLYSPSYVSLATALDFHSLIPEAVYTCQAVSSRQTTRRKTPIGLFEYFSISRPRFFGYRPFHSSQRSRHTQENFLIASPEKALIDYFYFQKREWTRERLLEMRFQDLSEIRWDRLEEYKKSFASPKVSRAVNRLRKLWNQGEIE